MSLEIDTSGFASDESAIKFGGYVPGAFKLAKNSNYIGNLHIKNTSSIVPPLTEEDVKKQYEESEEKMRSQLQDAYGKNTRVISEKKAKERRAQKMIKMVENRQKDDEWMEYQQKHRAECLAKIKGSDDEQLEKICRMDGTVWVNLFNSQTHPSSLVPGFRVAHITYKTYGTKRLLGDMGRAKHKPKYAALMSSDWAPVPIGQWFILGYNLKRTMDPELRAAKVRRTLLRWRGIRLKEAYDVDEVKRTQIASNKESILSRLKIERYRKYKKALETQRQQHVRACYEAAGKDMEAYDAIESRNRRKKLMKASKKTRRVLRLQSDTEALRASKKLVEEAAASDEPNPLLKLGRHLLPSGYGHPEAMTQCEICGGFGVGLVYKTLDSGELICKHCWRLKFPEDCPTDDEIDIEEHDDEGVDFDHNDTLEMEDFPIKFKTPERFAVLSYVIDMDSKKDCPECPEAAGREMIIRFYGCFSTEDEAEKFREKLENNVTHVEISIVDMYAIHYPEIMNWSKVKQRYREAPLEAMYQARLRNQKEFEEYEQYYKDQGQEPAFIDVNDPSATKPVGSMKFMS